MGRVPAPNLLLRRYLVSQRHQRHRRDAHSDAMAPDVTPHPHGCGDRLWRFGLRVVTHTCKLGHRRVRQDLDGLFKDVAAPDRCIRQSGFRGCNQVTGQTVGPSSATVTLTAAPCAQVGHS